MLFFSFIVGNSHSMYLSDTLREHDCASVFIEAGWRRERELCDVKTYRTVMGFEWKSWTNNIFFSSLDKEVVQYIPFDHSIGSRSR